jgi:hypothetical protein
VAALFAIGLVVTALRIKADLDRGRDALAELSLERLEGGLAETIVRASDRLDRAHERAEDSVFLKPLSLIPVVDDQVDALRDLTGTAAEIGAIGRQSAQKIEDVLERAGDEPLARLELLTTMSDELDRIEAAVEDVDVRAHGRLVGPLREGRDELVGQLEEVPGRFDEARGYLDALTTLLRGPRRYLVLAANNAEMRAGAGMPLQAGVATIAGGDIDFGDFRQLANERVPGTPELLPREWQDTWHNFKMGRSWVQTAVSPNFPTTAPVWAEMSAQSPTGPVDGVIEVDPVALQHLLEVIGPVELGGSTYTAENIVSKVLYENYLAFDTVEERSGRQEHQGAVAQAIFDALKTRDIEIADLALALREAAEGRHLLAWSRDADMQRLWEEVGASGQVPPIGLMVAVQNIAANKLDFFIEPRVAIAAYPETVSGDWRVQVTVAIENPEDAPTNAYIDGTHPDYRNGIHRAMVTLFMPASAYNYGAVNGEVSEAGPDPPVQMVAQRVLIEKGETARVAFEFRMPRDHVGALIIPSGRIAPVPYVVNGVTVTDAAVVPVFWVQPPEQERTPGAAAVAGTLALAGALAVLAGVRTRLRYAAARPLRPVPDLAVRALPFAFVLFLSALGALVAGWLISSAQ